MNKANKNMATTMTHVIEGLVKELLLAGKLEGAIELYERYMETPTMLNAFTRMAFFNRSRNALVPFMLKRADQLNRAIAPVILRNQVTLAEMSGSVLRMAQGLHAFEAALSDEALLAMQAEGDAVLMDAARSALGVFNINLAQRVASLINEASLRAELATTMDNYLEVCRASGSDPEELPQAASAIQTKARLLIDQPTVIVRISPNVWGALASGEIINPERLPDGFLFARELRHKGHHVRLAPQLSVPGPSLYTPFSRHQRYPMAIVDCHKYSKIGCFVHYKAIGNGYVQVERGGYSGWSEIQAYPRRHAFESLGRDEARKFCDAARIRTFGETPERCSRFGEYGRFAVVPLQIPGDSVQRLSPFSFQEMVDSCIRYFRSKGLNIVLRRHPQCKDREVTDYLSRLPKAADVFISDESTRELIWHSEVVALCNSSVGWDAILAHKPLFCFGLAEYSRVAHQVEELSDLEEIESISDILKPEMNDLLYFYFWGSFVSQGFGDAKKRVLVLVEEILGGPVQVVSMGLSSGR
ncbi:hypothetical protein [Pseudomonas sp. 6D_7.1_Bac1]|uniref:capsular polysaccharide export protein, LipB/KpsS family n=1 Tax=Pseudomonas sp. 6D_7.1_Bac1 TaxID=2971615 RepID=UPI0021C9D221|nr:hypothetical protein [Pseudomonas sp. 6D_7.1_Bac1]MCU1750288.1 hypothetical protein [Pseudomonas sp. 6D_7.1_Bac1]